MSYKNETVETKDLILQLQASESSIKDLSGDLLNKTKSFKHQIFVKVLLRKYKPNRGIEFTPVYSNLIATTVINYRLRLEYSFQETLYMFDACINKRSG